MASKTHIIVQPYVSGKKGALAPAPAIEVKTAEAGRVRAERMMEGGRVLGVVGRGSDIAEARNRAYEAASLIRFDGVHYRRDIAAKALQ